MADEKKAVDPQLLLHYCAPAAAALGRTAAGDWVNPSPAECLQLNTNYKKLCDHKIVTASNAPHNVSHSHESFQIYVSDSHPLDDYEVYDRYLCILQGRSYDSLISAELHWHSSQCETARYALGRWSKHCSMAQELHQRRKLNISFPIPCRLIHHICQPYSCTMWNSQLGYNRSLITVFAMLHELRDEILKLETLPLPLMRLMLMYFSYTPPTPKNTLKAICDKEFVA
jgi:hypothetical protein